MSRSGLHQIGDVAERVGLSLRTVRYYEEVGLVVPVERTSGGFRLYDDDAIERLALVKHMKPLDFTLEQTREVLELRERLTSAQLGARARAGVLERLEMYAAAARERCQRLSEQLAAAEGFAAALEADVERTRPSRRAAGRRR